MITKLTVRRVGGSLATTIPKELAERMHIAEGDELFAVETEGGVLLTPYDPEFERGMEAFEIVRKEYRNAFRELAK
ncbi:MAG: AbrB/MazE/SpoVT family DNA-binding domain-containing protein [Longimicrobiaceae bacterium]